MKSQKQILFNILNVLILVISNSCNRNNSPSKETVDQINLKRGDIVICGGKELQLGKVDFEITGSQIAKNDFNLALEFLHSFEYDEAEKIFAKIIYNTPNCSMAYWGVAMANFHPLWTPPTEAELLKGNKAIAIATKILKKSTRETDYINALATFYNDWAKTNHQSRCVNFEKAMEQLHKNYPKDKEAAIFYALSLDASAKVTDKTYSNQKKAALILNELYPTEPNHPGIIHYIIHTYDYPSLAELGLEAARKYASVAPSSAHALHMPSHIFTRLGLWDECISSNLESISAARCYAEQAKLVGQNDEEFHGMDYVVYAYLQKGDNISAKAQLHNIDELREGFPINLKTAYAFTAIPARILLENKNWGEAVKLQIHPSNFPIQKFPWQESTFHYARLLGFANLGKTVEATAELSKMKDMYNTLITQKDAYKAMQVAIQIKTGEAWLHFANENNDEAITSMKNAVEMEDATEKSPITPGELLPTKELLGDLFLKMQNYESAFQAYETSLKKAPNRFNSIYGAAIAANKMGNKQKAVYYFNLLTTIVGNTTSDRPEIVEAKLFLKNI